VLGTLPGAQISARETRPLIRLGTFIIYPSRLLKCSEHFQEHRSLHAKLAFAWRATQDAARALGVMIQSQEVRELKDIGATIAMMAQQPPDALIVLQDALTLQHKSEIIDFNMQKRLPGMFVAKEWVEVGGLMSYGESLTDMYRRTAYFVDKILKGAKPADLYLWSKSRRSDFFLPRVGSLPMVSLSPICSGRRRATILKGERPGDLPVRQPTIVRAGDQPEDRKGPRAASSFVSSLAADRRPHSDSAAASPLGVIESQPLVWPNLASSSHPCALAYLIAGRISPSFNPVSAAT
jgi:hypothetical protein